MLHKCTTVKPGTPCTHMGKNGCTYGGGECTPVIDKCEGCKNIQEIDGGKFCEVYAEPDHMWLNDTCPMATHVKVDIKVATQKINPLKASKRAAAGKK